MPYRFQTNLARAGRNLARQIIAGAHPQRARWLTFATGALLLGIGLADYLVDDDDQMSLRFFYCLAVMLAVTARGWKFGILTAVLSVIAMTAGDLAGYEESSRAFLLTWNALISFSTYILIVWLLHSLFTLQREIEERVRAGTRALILEAARREQLEKEIMSVGERERFSIGHDLHDGLC